ncbi:Uncharacterised protein [Chlamydia trachomatis]|nr:Uncharacterised protein [Chlamydia trachomatis]
MYPCDMAPASGKGTNGDLVLTEAALTNPLKIIPTCGPLPWPTITSCPALTSSAIFLAGILTSSFCSAGLFPKAFPPKAITILLIISILL